jgi:hypothetical protein
MQYEQHRNQNLFSAVRSWLSLLLTLVIVPLLVLVMGQGLMPPAPSPVGSSDPDIGLPIGAELQSIDAGTAPLMDGTVDAVWHGAPVLSVPLHFGTHGTEPAGTVELRSLHDETNVYFLARWPTPDPGGEPDTWRNLASVHWRLADSGKVSGAATGSNGLACTVGCHTITVDDQGHLVNIRAETIPVGLDEDLASGGGWSNGEWLLEWSRPKISPSPYEQDIVDSNQAYRFFVKLFLGLEDRPDAVSDIHELRLSQ